MKTTSKISISHAKGYYLWLQSIRENYSVMVYIGNTVRCVESEQKEIVYEMIEQDLTPSDFMKTESGNYALETECQDISDIIWHLIEDVPKNIVYDEINGEYIHIDDSIYGYIGRCEGFFSDNEVYYRYCDNFYHENSLSCHDLVIDHEGDILHHDDACFCEDIEEYVYVENAHYSEVVGCFYYHENNMPESKTQPCDIVGYHDSGDADDLSNNSLFKVGYEVEKSSFFGNDSKGDYIGEHDIFKGYELDGSCGVEAITNILPLSIESFNYVHSLMNDAAKVINSDINSNCGGHVTVSVNGMNGNDIYDMIKPYIGVFYAMYRYRLNNTYCNGNKDLKSKNYGKYSTVNMKGNLVELRIPSAVKNVEQLFFRHQMTFHLLFAAYHNIGFEQYLDNCQHLLKSVYRNTETINELSILFQDYIDHGILKPKVQRFIQED